MSGDEVLWPGSTKFGFKVSGSVRDCLKKQHQLRHIYQIGTIMYWCASEISRFPEWRGLRHTRTMFEHFWLLFRFLQLLASLRGSIEVKSDRWVSSRSWKNPTRWQIENTHEIMRWVLHVSAVNLKMLRGMDEELQIPVYSSWQRLTQSIHVCHPQASFQEMRSDLLSCQENLKTLQATPWVRSGLGIVYECLAFCRAQTLQQDRSSEFSFTVFLTSSTGDVVTLLSRQSCNVFAWTLLQLRLRQSRPCLAQVDSHISVANASHNCSEIWPEVSRAKVCEFATASISKMACEWWRSSLNSPTRCVHTWSNQWYFSRHLSKSLTI